MAQPTIMIVAEAYAVTMSAVLDAMGRGHGTFSRRALAAVIDPLTITHRATRDMGAEEEFAAQARAMAENRDLPPINGVWGENGVPTAAEAQEAMEHFTVVCASGPGVDMNALHLATLASMGLVDWYPPEEEE